MEEPDNDPDVFDLEDWLKENHPEAFQAMRYLQYDTFYQAAKKIWQQAGCPEL